MDKSPPDDAARPSRSAESLICRPHDSVSRQLSRRGSFGDLQTLKMRKCYFGRALLPWTRNTIRVRLRPRTIPSPRRGASRPRLRGRRSRREQRRPVPPAKPTRTQRARPSGPSTALRCWSCTVAPGITGCKCSCARRRGCRGERALCLPAVPRSNPGIITVEHALCEALYKAGLISWDNWQDGTAVHKVRWPQW